MAVQWFNPYYVFGGEGGSGTGKVFTKTENGLVPAPGASAGDDLVLRSDGTWGQGGGGSATVGLGKQAKQAMWPGEYTKISQTPVPPIGQWDFKDPEDFYKEMQSLPGYFWDDDPSNISAASNVGYMLEYLRNEDVKSSIIKFIKYCNGLGCPLLASWGGDELFYICTIYTTNQYPSTRLGNYGIAYRGLSHDTDVPEGATVFRYQKFLIPESEEIMLPSVDENGTSSNVKIAETGIAFLVKSTGIKVYSDFGDSHMTHALDAQYPAPKPKAGETLPYTPNYVGGCLSANISGYNNYGTLSSIKYDNGSLTFVNTQGATVITMPGATATGEDELTLNDLQKIVYNEESSPKKLEIYDKTGTLRFTVNDSSAGT